MDLVTPDDHESDSRQQADQFARRASNQGPVRSVSVSSVTSGLDPFVYAEMDEHEHSKELQGVQLEASSKGTFKGSKAMHYFRAGANWPVLLALLFLALATQMVGSAADIWVAIW